MVWFLLLHPLVFTVNVESCTNWTLVCCRYIQLAHHPHYILTNHAIKNIVFQVFKVVVDWLICCDSRIIHEILSLNADLPLILIFCDAFVQHKLSKVYWWGGEKYISTTPYFRLLQHTQRVLNFVTLVFLIEQ